MLSLHVLLVTLSAAHGALLYAHLGDNVTLRCFYASSAKHMCWYKQVAGEQPRIMSSFYKHRPDLNSFHNQFKDSRRFSVHAGGGFYHLNISEVQDSDSAAYYCGQTSITVTEFDKGTFLIIKDTRRSFLLQPPSHTVQPGGSVTLNCTVLAGTSDGEHSVHWFKRDPGNSPFGIMYAHKHSSRRQCVRSSEPGSPAHSCVHSLPKRNVSLSDAGTYYCAVASCGDILFGGGTRLHVDEERRDPPPGLVYGVTAALVASVMSNVILLCILCRTARRTCPHPEGSHPRPGPSEYTANSQNEESAETQYVALDFKRRQGTRRQENAEEETIYSGVRRSDLG